MYKYYSLERPVSIGTYPVLKDNRLLSFDNFEEGNLCVKKTIVDNDKVFKAWGYLLFEKPLSSKQIDDYELGDAGAVNRLTKINTLPLDFQETLRNDINEFYKVTVENSDRKPFKMTREGFLDMYGSFTLEDFHKMMPRIANKYHFIDEKDKSALEKLMDGNTRYESILDTMEINEENEELDR